MRMPHDTMCTGAPHACSLFYFYVWAIHDLHCLADPYVRRRSVASNPWATAHLGHLELRSTCELTRLAQRGRRATAMARTSPATQRSTIMAPRGVLQPLGYGSLGSSCAILSLASLMRCAPRVIIVITIKINDKSSRPPVTNFHTVTFPAANFGTAPSARAPAAILTNSAHELTAPSP